MIEPTITSTIASFIAKGTVILHVTRPDSTQEYIVNCASPFEAATLVVHPPEAPTDYTGANNERIDWYVRHELYADKDQYDLRGSDILDLDGLDELANFLNERGEATKPKP